MLRITRRSTHVFLAIVASFCLSASILFAADPSKPSGFTGYLLDSAGLEPEHSAEWTEDFESPGVSWRYLYQDGSIKIQKHERVDDEAREGKRSETIQYEVEESGVIVFGHYVDYPSVYDDAAPSVWVRSDRPGVSLAVLVVFPNTPRPDTGAPLTAILVGTTYQNPGEWSKLTFPNGLEKTLESAVQAIKGEHKLPVDPRRAYIRQVLLLSEARYGSYQLWIDDLEIGEHIRPELSILQKSEKNAAFNPLNLLSCRLKLSQTPLFFQEDLEESKIYGKEPFAIDSGKVEFNKNKQTLSFVKPKESTKAASKNADPMFDIDHDSLAFEESKHFLPSVADDVLRPFNELLAQNTRSTRSISTYIDNKNAVGQTSFVEDGSNAPFAQDMLSPLPKLREPKADYLVPSSDNASGGELISGSGTLPSSELAATTGFFKKADRLIANATIEYEKGNLVTNDQKIYSLRAIEYNGESFEFLKNLGFNAIWLNESPTPKILREAQDVGVWLIAYPPSGEQGFVTEEMIAAVGTDREVETLSEIADPNGKITNAYDPVVMWNLGKKMRAESGANVRNYLAWLQASDPRRRPIIASIYNGVQEFVSKGQKIDVVLLDREPLLSSLDLNDYGEWLVNYQTFFPVKSIAFWNQIQTQPNENLVQQRLNFGLADETPGLVTYEQMRQCARLSMRAGCRGLLFASKSRLDSKDRKTQYRAKALEAINLETQFLLTWFALSNSEKRILETTSPDLEAIVFKVDRAALIAPISTAKNNQFVMGQDAAYNWEATVAVPESYSPDLLTPGALRRVVSKRKAGGCAFTLDEGSMNSLLFFTQSDSLCQKMADQAEVFGRRMAELAIDLARKRVDMYEQTVYGLQYIEKHGIVAKNIPPSPQLGPVVDRALITLAEAEQSLKRRDVSHAYLAAERATREIRNLERTYWEEATKTEIARPVTPLSTSFYDMPSYIELYQKLVVGKIRSVGGNLIRGGNMENPQTLTTNDGWQIYKESSFNLSSTVTSDAESARTGKLGMHITVESPNDQPPVEAECPVVCVESQLPTQKGQLVCVQGWIKIPKDLQNSVDGVRVYADQGGGALALRFKQSCDWKRFAFYRVASNDNMRIRFEFSGIGDVYLDDIAAYVVQ